MITDEQEKVSKMLNYPVDIIDSTQGFTIQFLDVPEAITYGETLEEALENAVDCIDTAVEFYYEEKRAIPMPSSADGRYTVSPSPLVKLKIVLHNEMLALLREYQMGAYDEMDDFCDKHIIAALIELHEANRPKPEPLSEEEIEKLVPWQGDLKDPFFNRIEFARAIEKAHGIGITK